MTFVPPPGYMPAYNPPLPYVAPVMGGLWPGMAIYIQGVVAPQPDWLRVNLSTGPDDSSDLAGGGHWGDTGGPFPVPRLRVNLSTGPDDGSDLALHLNPRFQQGVTVFNSRRHGRWEDEKRRELHPLCPGAPFEMVISVTPEGYRVRGMGYRGALPRFQINLRAGPGGDVVLHVSPRMDEGGQVVRNCFLGGSWGHEERDLACCSPFQPGRYFDLSIRCGNHRFKVFAEGQPLFDFHHRVPAGPHVDVLEIEGDVVLSYVHF
ncbi:PREDICTED: galectin-4-like [Sturnus vulgaris]|uniref:galectin-4-like n=1 Tax=Sturnus vulgaris TaxID=9172 RepID=UPI00071A791A|nr:PREDICTED: galectin-4-like [Sturnus vulgaris]